MAPESMAPQSFDVVVAGAGAAGLLAAATAAARGRRTLLLEKNLRPGLKILISGGGRCNVTTTRSGQDLEDQYGQRRGRFLRHALRTLPPAAVRALFEQLGVPLQEEDLEKLFPVSQQARDVLDALLRYARDQGAELRAQAPLLAVRADGDAFAVTTPGAALRAQSVVLATGGRSYPKTGATGDGYAIAAAFGHTITRTVPALAPLWIEDAWLRELQGIVLQDVELSSLDAQGRVLCRRTRPILFTHKGLSGPAPMDLAGDVEEHAGAAVRFDFAPGRTAEQIEAEWLLAGRSQGRAHAESLLPAHLQARVQTALCQLAGCAEQPLATLARDARRRLLALVKDLRVPVPKSLGFDHAEVTRGGVALDEIDPKTMQSKLQPGLFVCGELLDVDGPIGGFNFQAAFATGRLAGLHA
jgi:predicted Rossmann fold flavoprotein